MRTNSRSAAVAAHVATFTSTVIAALLLSGSIQAASIGIDWFGGNGTGDQTQMLSTDIAGVVPQGNWNSFLDDTVNAVDTFPLILDNGAASGATVSITGSPNDWDTNIVEATSANHKLMLGYVDTNDTSITTIRVSGLPNSITLGGYNVIVYYDGDNGTQTRAGRYEIGGVSQWGKDVASTSFSGTFTQGQTLTDPTIASGGVIDSVPTAVLDAVPAGNYMVFGPFTGADFTLNVQASVSAGTTNRAPLNGLQIVAVPEPATLALFGTCAAIVSAGVFMRRRRNG